MQVTEGRGGCQRTPGLRREVVVPVPAYRRPSAVVGLSLVLVLMASAVDAVVWTYRAQRRFWRAEATESLRRALSRRQAADRVWIVPLADPLAAAYSAEELTPALPPRPACE